MKTEKRDIESLPMILWLMSMGDSGREIARQTGINSGTISRLHCGKHDGSYDKTWKPLHEYYKKRMKKWKRSQSSK